MEKRHQAGSGASRWKPRPGHGGANKVYGYLPGGGRSGNRRGGRLLERLGMGTHFRPGPEADAIFAMVANRLRPCRKLRGVEWATEDVVAAAGFSHPGVHRLGLGQGGRGEGVDRRPPLRPPP